MRRMSVTQLVDHLKMSRTKKDAQRAFRLLARRAWEESARGQFASFLAIRRRAIFFLFDEYDHDGCCHNVSLTLSLTVPTFMKLHNPLDSSSRRMITKEVDGRGQFRARNELEKHVQKCLVRSSDFSGGNNIFYRLHNTAMTSNRDSLIEIIFIDFLKQKAAQTMVYKASYHLKSNKIPNLFYLLFLLLNHKIHTSHAYLHLSLFC